MSGRGPTMFFTRGSVCATDARYAAAATLAAECGRVSGVGGLQKLASAITEPRGVRSSCHHLSRSITARGRLRAFSAQLSTRAFLRAVARAQAATLE
eukprot:IDg10715t1